MLVVSWKMHEDGRVLVKICLWRVIAGMGSQLALNFIRCGIKKVVVYMGRGGIPPTHPTILALFNLSRPYLAHLVNFIRNIMTHRY